MAAAATTQAPAEEEEEEVLESMDHVNGSQIGRALMAAAVVAGSVNFAHEHAETVTRRGSNSKTPMMS